MLQFIDGFNEMTQPRNGGRDARCAVLPNDPWKAFICPVTRGTPLKQNGAMALVCGNEPKGIGHGAPERVKRWRE